MPQPTWFDACVADPHVTLVGRVRGAAVPDWSLPKRWRPTVTAKFHHHLRLLPTKLEQNVAFNTLLALCVPDRSQLEGPPGESATPCWQLSSLRGYQKTLQIVWIAKAYKGAEQRRDNKHWVGVVEASFVGTRTACLHYVQMHTLPAAACRVKRDMSGILPTVTTDAAVVRPAPLAYAWMVTNDLQAAIFHGEALPQGLFVLDPPQERIVTLTPPLLLESRSGTGKTNCLFCHALSYARQTVRDTAGDEADRDEADRGKHILQPILFLTVSARLSRSLAERYREVERLETCTLVPIAFFALSDFLEKLLLTCHIPDFARDARCTFAEYVGSRSSHEKMDCEPSLVENEIGGCILGSLAAALHQRPLTRPEYLEEIRSNISRDTDEGLRLRGLVYNEFTNYRTYKEEHGKHDVDDIVLRLIGEDVKSEIFQSAYIDEVQDFSYSSMYLICSVAGRKEARWVAAGDTAQMITPGCSFTFDGLKQTLRAIKDTVKINKVEQLTRNYRVSKGVLVAGNAILRLLKTHYPRALEYAPPEKAMKDLGLPVVLLDWDKAVKNQVSFGAKQAVIYTSSDNPTGVVESVSQWIGEHPFILSSLDSKGLEFEDVVVHALDVPRKTWNVGAGSSLSLLLLRELYVAVTRAQQRVVVLTKGKSPAIAEFFRSLNCSIEEVQPASILVEFQKETTANDWFSKGAELYEEEKYDLAAGCYKAASQFGWKGRASGRFDLARGQKEDAGASFRNAARIFFESLEYKNCLDTMTDLATIQPWKHTWTESDNELLDDALKREPNHLPRSATVIFALIRGSWDVLQSTDLMDVAAESTFTPFRTETKLKDLVRACSDAERKKIEDTLPNVIGDYYHDRKSAPDATRLYFRGRDFASAVAALEKALASNVGDDSILTIVQYWLDDSHARQYLSSIKGGTPAYLLVSLFEDPKVAFSQPVGKNKYIRVLGKDVVRFAVTDMSAGSETAEILHRIDNRIYRDDILALLVTKKQPSEVVTWFLEHENKEHAVDFAVSRLGDWADTELLSFIPNLLNHSHKSLVDELERLSLLESAVAICLNPNTWDLQMAEVVSNRALSEVPERRPTEEQGTIVFVFTAMWRARQTDDRVMSWMKNGISSPIKFFLAANQSRIEEESDSSSDDDGSVPALLGKIAAGNSSEESSDDDMPGLEDRHRDDDNNSSEDDLPGLVAPQHDNAANSSDDSSDDGSAPPRMEARNRAGSYDGSSSSSSYNYDHKDDDDSSDSDGNGPPVMVPHRPK